MAKNVAWDLLKHCASPIPGVDFNEVELTVKYPNGSKLTLYGADNPDSLRGIGLWGVVFDEYSQQPSNIFTEIIRPALADHEGYAIWIGTPKGKNELYRLYLRGKSEEGWLSLLMTVEDTKLLPEAELADARKQMSADEFAQEFYCSFDASIKGAYYAQEIAEARHAGRVKPFAYDRALLVHTVWDLGKGPNMAVGFYQRSGTEVRKIDYWEGSGDEALPDAIRILQAKSYVYGKHFVPHDIEVVELGSGVSRLETAKKLGVNFEIVPKLSVQDGIDAAKRMWPRLWVNETNCQLWLDAIAQYRREWDDRRGMFKDTPLHDWTSHGADEFRYAAVMEEKMRNEAERIPQATTDLVKPFFPQLGV
jgi:phage terminase large subunit